MARVTGSLQTVGAKETSDISPGQVLAVTVPVLFIGVLLNGADKTQNGWFAAPDVEETNASKKTDG
ncbi:hypothetical protein KCP71_06180 [Salmonella enterica subsp. enterica]|nr:hypothetical protein KCP71_06180 [Salmonella enterica subsp. enterica]